jgi:hypothetical protein
MRLFRFSIRSLLALVFFCGIALAALVEPTAPWAVGLFALAVISFSLAGLAAFLGRSSKRAVYAGFALFGWCYLTVAFGPWFRDAVRPHLPTTKAIDGFPQRRLGMLPCPDDCQMTPPSPDSSYKIGGFQRWPGYDGMAICVPTISLRERIGHSLFSFIVAAMGSIFGRSLIPPPYGKSDPPVAA